MTRPTILLLASAMVSALFLGADAQESLRPEPKLLRDWPAPSKLQQRVTDLEQNRARVTKQLTDDFRKTQSYDTRPVMLDALRRRMSDSFRDRELQYEEIRQRLGQLENALSNRQRELPAAPEPLLNPDPPADLQPTPPATPGDKVEPETDDTSMPPTIPAPQLTQPPEPKPTIEPSPTIVTESAVDRISLADSLFASHQIDIALKLYRELAVEKHSKEDLTWIHYQIASSGRRVKDYDLARKYYRIVAGQQDAGLYQKLSKWWLDTIQRRLSYEQEQARLQAFLEQTGGADVATSN